jgi:ATP-dependent RNA helicase RhlB
MLFSATLNMYVKNLALEYTKSPVEIEIEAEHITVDEIDQRLYHVPSEKKFSLLLGLLGKLSPESAIIFCNTKRYTETIARRLRSNGIQCEFISGDLPQRKRLEIIEDLKAGRNRFLVATDVAARGLDIEALALVVNYDLPNESENYVHRIGRTARAGAKGIAVSFASEQDVYDLTGIERYIDAKIPSFVAYDDDYAEDNSGGGLFGRQRRDNRDNRRDGGGYGRQRENRGGDRERRDRGERGERGERGGERQRYGKGPRSNSAQPRSNSSPQQAEKRVKLSTMSTDERMEYYKEKYGAPGAEGERTVSTSGETGGNSSNGGNKRKDGGAFNDQNRQKNKRNRKKGGQSERKQTAQGAQSRGGGKSGNNGKGAESGAKSAPAKKGIFAHIASLFGKK